MNKVVNFKNKTNEDNFSKATKEIKERKKRFVAPMQRMKDSIQNDMAYLSALGIFIEQGQKKIQELADKKANLDAARLQVEIMEAIGKFQANEGLVNDKVMHYEKVFLPRYEEELKDSKENFAKNKEELEKIASLDNHPTADQVTLSQYMKKELKEFNDSDAKDDEEFQSYTNKIFKRLLGKYNEVKQ